MAFLNETGLEQVWDKIKTKVNTIENTIDDINEAKVDKVDGKGLSTEDYTTAEKEKLAGIATGATKVIVDSALSSTSENAIQNKVVANMKSDIDDTLSTKFDTITTSGDGNIITDISKSGTTINAEKNAFATTVKEGNPVSEVGAAGAGFSVKTTFEPKQEGSGDPSPDNIRTISGWTGVKLTRCGKNMLKNTATSQTINGVTFTVNIDGSVTVNGTATAHAYFVVGKSTLSAGAYIVSGCPANGSNSKYFVYADYSGGTNDYGSGGTFTLAETKEVAPTIVVRSGTTVSNLTFHPMIRLASETDAAFVVYQGETLSATFNQTAYGGTLDWNTGVLTVDRAIFTFDGSEAFIDPDWPNPYAYVVWNLLPGSVNYGWDNTTDAYCSHYIASSVGNAYSNAITGFAIYDGSHSIFSSPTHTTLDAFKSYLAAQYAAGTPVQVCYKLATPTTIQLTPHDLRMLDGTNNVYSDGNTNYVIFNSGASSLAQVDKNYLKLTGGILTGSLHIKNSATWSNIIMNSSYSNKNAGIIYNSIPSDSAVNYLGFRTYSRSSSDYSLLDYYENFELPSTSSNRTSNVSYSILTSKYAVTIPQGGTGATTAEGARTNLDVPSKTGEGASGTWGINISGNAATATKIGTSTIGDTQTPIYLNGGTPTICSTYNNRIYAYDSAPYYTYSFGGGQDLNWKKIFSASDTATAPSSATYHGATIKGKIFYTTSNYNAGEVREYDFVMYATFISATSIMDSCILKVSAGCPDTIIRAVRVSTNSFELQVRQPTDWHKICVQFCYRSIGATVSHCAPTDSSNSDVIAFSRLETSKYISDANNGRPITLRYSGSGLSSTSWLACWDGYQLAPISPSSINAGSATKLATARTLTIGNTGKSFDGSENVSWSLSEIGAAASNHTHSYLPLSGGIMTGPIINGGLIFSRGDNYTTDIAPNNINWYSIGYSSSMKDGSSPWWDQYFALCINNYWGIDIRVRDANSMRLNGNIVLNTENYNSYSPTLTGGGASGTWGISITGGAAAANEDGNGNVISSTYCKLSGGNQITPPANGNFTASDTSGAWFFDTGFSHCSIGRGNGDGASLGTSGKANLFIKSWYGVGFVSTQANTGITVAINCRTGEVLANKFTGSGASLTSLNASNITSGTLAVGNGGTGATSKSGARTNLGIISGTSLPSASGYSTGDIFILY